MDDERVDDDRDELRSAHFQNSFLIHALTTDQ